MYDIKAFLFDDDRGVSPVIGVILMVAITVILAAVIASFVLGLGDTNQKAPDVTFEFDFEDNVDDTGTGPNLLLLTKVVTRLTVVTLSSAPAAGSMGLWDQCLVTDLPMMKASPRGIV